MKEARVIDVEVQVHHKTEKAVLVSDDGDKDKAVWLPLSQIEIEHHAKGMATVTAPDWLLYERGLL